MRMPVVGFAGLTHLGIVSAAAAAAAGFNVVGFDPDAAAVAAIKQGRLPVTEPGLDDLIIRHRAQITISDRAVALSSCDVVYISSDVATDPEGQSDLSGISSLIAQVLPILGDHAILVVLCQVPPGFTRSIAFPRLFYQVETLIFGRAMERAQQPERFIVGCADPSAPLPGAYAELLQRFGCPILPMRYESAELAKIAINCFLAASLNTANTLAELSECVGADWREIIPALRLDGRIGPQAYVAAGLGIGGANIERDLVTVQRLARDHGSDVAVIDAFRHNSRYRRDWALRVLHSRVLHRQREPSVGILGLAYKENTQSTRNSPALALIAALQPWALRIHDPVVPATVVEHPRVSAVDTPESAAEGVAAVAIMTPWPQYRRLSAAVIARAMAGRVVVDPFGVLDSQSAAAAGLEHHVLGASISQ